MNLYSMPHPLAGQTSSFTLKVGWWGQTPLAIPSSWRMSQALESHTPPVATEPHLALTHV